VKEFGGAIFVRFHPTNREMANLISIRDQKHSIVAVINGNLHATPSIPEYISQPLVDVPPYVPPKVWPTPTPLDDLLSSGIVTKK
jgi:hypothetical protein